MIPLTITVTNPDELLSSGAYGTGALISLERSATEAGQYAEVTTIAILAGITGYTYFDDAQPGNWYRSRYKSADSQKLSEYSEAWQGGVESLIVSLTDVKARIGITDSKEDALLIAFIDATTRTFDAITGRRFVGDAADAVYLFDGRAARRGGMVLPLPHGMQSVTKLELAGFTGDAYYEVDAADYFLQPAQPAPGWPYTSIEFSDRPSGKSTYTHVYSGLRTVRLTGKEGFASVPSDVAEIAHHVIARYHKAKNTGDANVAGTTQFGTAIVLKHLVPEERNYLDQVYRDWSY